MTTEDRPMTPAAQTSEPQTAAGRKLLDWLRFARKRTGAAGIPDIDAILAIEAEAAAPASPDVVEALDVERLGMLLFAEDHGRGWEWWWENGPLERRKRFVARAEAIAAAYAEGESND